MGHHCCTTIFSGVDLLCSSVYCLHLIVIPQYQWSDSTKTMAHLASFSLCIQHLMLTMIVIGLLSVPEVCGGSHKFHHISHKILVKPISHKNLFVPIKTKHHVKFHVKHG